MMHEPTPRRHEPDLTSFCERLAERLSARGAAHPVAAAVALAARGAHGVDVGTFANDIGVAARALRQVEAGTVAFADLPDELACAYARIPSANLFLTADLDSRMGRA
jgi:hypothetical protein